MTTILEFDLTGLVYNTVVNLLSPHFESWKIEAEFDKNSKKVEMWGCTIQGTEVTKNFDIRRDLT